MEFKQQLDRRNKQLQSHTASRQPTQTSVKGEDLINVTSKARLASDILSSSDISLLQGNVGNQAIKRVLQQRSLTCTSNISKQQKALIQPKSIIKQANIQCEEDNEFPNTSIPLAINVREIGDPHGLVQHSTNLSTTYSVQWGCFIYNDTLLFEYSNDHGHAATVNVILEDDQGNGWLASGSVSWTEGETQKKYLEFRGFPQRADGSVMDSCYRTATLTNDASPGTGYEVGEKIYRG